MKLDLDYQLASTQTSLPSKEMMELWLQATLLNQCEDVQMSIRIVDKDEGQQLNSQYRGKDKPTNVLSFPFEKPAGIPSDEFDSLLGDLVICAPVVSQEAAEQEKTEMNHWAHMVVHGTLHLLGYDHIKDDDADIMEQLERNILATLDIPNPYLGDHEV
ncbi:MAG: rRNA maturation RNase YbeY [Reinekea sp.]|jgi:probable rRNA maturation factor